MARLKKQKLDLAKVEVAEPEFVGVDMAADQDETAYWELTAYKKPVPLRCICCGAPALEVDHD